MATIRIPPAIADAKKTDATPSIQPNRPQNILLLPPPQRYAAAADRLQELDVLLQGLYRLHKNQHRVSTYWWPAFDQLRRHVRRLDEDMRPLVDTKKNNNKNKDKSKDKAKAKDVVKEQANEKRAVERAVDIRDSFIPKAYLAFSRLVADRRFAQLGLLMMGILAQVHTALRWITGETAKKMLAGSEEEEDADDQNLETETADLNKLAKDHLGDDFGEVIARAADSDDEKEKAKTEPPTLSADKKTAATPLQSTKKRPRDDSDSDSGHVKSLKSLAKQPPKTIDTERVERSEKKRKVDVESSVSKSEVKETRDISEKRDKKDRKEKKEKEKEKEKAKKSKKKKKGGDEFDDLFSGLL